MLRVFCLAAAGLCASSVALAGDLDAKPVTSDLDLRNLTKGDIYGLWEMLRPAYETRGTGLIKLTAEGGMVFMHVAVMREGGKNVEALLRKGEGLQAVLVSQELGGLQQTPLRGADFHFKHQNFDLAGRLMLESKGNLSSNLWLGLTRLTTRWHPGHPMEAIAKGRALFYQVRRWQDSPLPRPLGPVRGKARQPIF